MPDQASPSMFSLVGKELSGGKRVIASAISKLG